MNKLLKRKLSDLTVRKITESNQHLVYEEITYLNKIKNN